MVLAVGRLSDPVADDDLDALVLEKSEVDDLKRCRVGNCEVKLAAGEIAAIQGRFDSRDPTGARPCSARFDASWSRAYGCMRAAGCSRCRRMPTMGAACRSAKRFPP
jgi:hypothetical protein